MEYLLQCFLIVLPILITGIFFIFSIKRRYFSFLQKPVDLEATFRGRRIFGDNKMLRGFIIMPVGTFLSVLIIGHLITRIGVSVDNLIFDYTFAGSYKALLYGLAYSAGELPNSFIKRQLGIAPGMRANSKHVRDLFDFFDKADSLLFCSVTLLLIYKISPIYVIGSFIIGLFFHFLTDFVMIRSGLKHKT